MKPIRVVGINFDHMHMGDNLRMAFEHPDCEIVGVCDETPERMADAVRNCQIDETAVFTDYRKCIEQTQPDLVILCPATAHHGQWTERIAPFGKPILMEKPFAASLEEADTMIAACEKHNVSLAINWPLAWVPSHCTAKRLIAEGKIGQLNEVHYYDGNRGPLWHSADKIQKTAEEVDREKSSSWFYQQSAGGGSLLDYLGYGTTLGTWFLDGAVPIEITATAGGSSELEVDEHSISVARYSFGLSKFETRWGTFTDPWVHQPQPKCGFVLMGTEGTIASYDYEPTIRMQSRDCPEGEIVPVDELQPPHQNPIQYLVHCIKNDCRIEGPLSPQISRIGQQIVDAAARSIAEKRTVPLID